jgi:hypothetical protein
MSDHVEQIEGHLFGRVVRDVEDGLLISHANVPCCVLRSLNRIDLSRHIP